MKKILALSGMAMILIAFGFGLGSHYFPNMLHSATGQLQVPINTSVNNSSWTAISLGSGQKAGSFIAKTRGGDNWKFSNSSTGAKYFTVDGDAALAMDIRIPTGGTIGYVQTATTSDTLEVIITTP